MAEPNDNETHKNNTKTLSIAVTFRNFIWLIRY